MEKANRKCIHAISSLLFFIFFSTNAMAQEQPLWQALQRHLKSEPFNLGLLLQAVADGQLERSEPGRTGFSIANTRLRLYGELDRGFGYFVQTNFAGGQTLLDAKVYYKISPKLIVDIGQLKSPFGAEFLIYAGSIDFVNRAQASSLGPRRQIGVQARGWLSPERVHYSAGIFNGNGTGSNRNDNNAFLYAGRLTFYSLAGQSAADGPALEVGINGGYSNDTPVQATMESEDRSRTFLGADFRWSQQRYMVSGELIYNRQNLAAQGTFEPLGYHLTAGMHVTEKAQVLLRWDSMKRDGLAPDSDFVVLGYNLWPTEATELQINYLINTDRTSLDNQQLLINAQLAF